MSSPTTSRPAAPAAAAPSPHRSLRNYLLDPGLQLRFGGYLVGITTAFGAVLCWRMWRATREASKLVALGDARTDEVVAQMLRMEDRSRLLWLVGILAGLVLVLLILAVMVTHRIAGPAMVLGRACRAVGEGGLVPQRPLRRGDFLVGLAEEVWAMIAALREREEQERVQIGEALQALQASPDRARAILERLSAEKARRLQA
jgi:hypothetical protein